MINNIDALLSALGDPTRRRQIIERLACLKVAGLGRTIAMQLAPETIVVCLNVHFRESLLAMDMNLAMGRIEAVLRKRDIDVATIFIEPTLPTIAGSYDALPSATARSRIARPDLR